MVNYEVTFIVDPVLSGDEINATAQTYIELLKNEGCNIVYVNEMGLRQLAYEINRRQSGVYFCVEFETEKGDFLANMELSLRRDERIMRFLTTRLDKFGVKYNEDKRNGLIGKKKVEKKRDDNDRDRNDRDRNDRGDRDRNDRNDRDRNAPRNEAPRTEAPAPKNEAPKNEVPAPVIETPTVEVPAPVTETPTVEVPETTTEPTVTAE